PAEIAPMAAPAAAAEPLAPAARAEPAAHPGAVPSPMVGTVYLSPDPDSAPFVTVGQKVSEGDTLLLIEAMKTFNPIAAPKSGEVQQILVEDSQPVEYGEALVVLG
ncbi:MAG: acetyl-CoA carboxylase, biotin carboxyl carrier protein, partial [Caulobacterales bacterium]|nr:acetyl-CoA carboxylase, biotin carboxyl carrier protein [Caulobacterales bacterium]